MLTLYSLRDVSNTYDFLIPLIGVVQFIFVIGIYNQKIWGLLGFTIILFLIYSAIAPHYIPKGETDLALETMLFLAPLVFINIYHWTIKRKSVS